MTDWLTRAARLDPATRPFVGGDFVATAAEATFPSVSPRDGTVLAHVAAGDESDVDRAVRAARAAFADGITGPTSYFIGVNSFTVWYTDPLDN